MNVNIVSPQVIKIHKELELLPKVNAFLDSIKRNSVLTSKGYKTALAYFQEFLSNRYHRNYTIENILPSLLDDKMDVYRILEEFITFMHKEKKISAVSINQYLRGIRSYLAYYDVYIIPNKFRHKVKVPKIFREEEQALDAKDIREILLNCHNRRLKAYLLVLASGGLRATEACAIRLCDIDFSVNPTKIHVRKEYTKTRIARDIYISDEATKYLKDWIDYKYNNRNNNSNTVDNNRSTDYNNRIDYNKKKKSEYLVFQVQIHNQKVTPQSIYAKLMGQFQQLLSVAGFSERKEGMKRRKITLHSFRRFVKTTLSDCTGKEYSEWFLGHAKSSYYVSKQEIRAATYNEKCMKYLTFLDYSTLEATGKNIEAKLSEKEKEIQLLRQRDSVNTDAIANLSDQVMKLMVEVQELKNR